MMNINILFEIYYESPLIYFDAMNIGLSQVNILRRNDRDDSQLDDIGIIRQGS